MTIDKVLLKLQVFKIQDAYSRAQEIPQFPLRTMNTLKEMAKEYGNCGIIGGERGDKLKTEVDRVAASLGYRWDEANYSYIRISPIMPMRGTQQTTIRTGRKF